MRFAPSLAWDPKVRLIYAVLSVPVQKTELQRYMPVSQVASYFEDAFGPQKLHRISESLCKPSLRTCLRVNTRQTTAQVGCWIAVERSNNAISDYDRLWEVLLAKSAHCSAYSVAVEQPPGQPSQCIVAAMPVTCIRSHCC